jgi:heme A synthase
MVHACLAQAFFCLVIYLCVALSVGRTERSAAARNRLPAAAFACIFVQLIIGSVMRHTQSGLAIPTFPLVFGGLWPTEWSFPVAIHYLHRVWAGVVLVFVIITLASMQRHRCHGSAMTAAWLMAVLTVVQLTLGAAVILGHRAVIPTCAHVIVGALLLACSFCCMLWARLAQAEPSGNLSTANL